VTIILSSGESRVLILPEVLLNRIVDTCSESRPSCYECDDDGGVVGLWCFLQGSIFGKPDKVSAS
jgi:hypothetical protein